MDSSPPFPFLSLPKELRLIIYSFVLPCTKHLPILLPPSSPNQDCLKLVYSSLPFLPLLLTCWQIHSESHSILRKRAAFLSPVTLAPIRIISTTAGLSQDRLLSILICISLTSTNCPTSANPLHLVKDLEPHEHSTSRLAPGTPKRKVDIAIINPSVRRDGFRGTKQALEQDMLDLGFDLKYCGVGIEKMALDVRVRAALLEGKEEEDTFGEIEAPRTARGLCWFVKGGKAIEREEWDEAWAEG